MRSILQKCLEACSLSRVTVITALLIGAFLTFRVPPDDTVPEDVGRLEVAVPVRDIDAPYDNVIPWADGNGFDCVIIDTAEVNPEDYAGLLLPGGDDIDPSFYGKEKQPTDTIVHPEFDRMEIELVQKFVAAGKPIFGICRGCQVINVALGGTLEQHIPGEHRENRPLHVGEDSWLYGYIADQTDVFHVHHQCVDVLGEGLTATEWDALDGRIEGFQHEYLPIYGVQWHPEYSDDAGRAAIALFRYICYKDMTSIHLSSENI